MNTCNSLALLALSATILSGCASFRSDASPDVVYDTRAEAARELQVPPDLTDISNAEQFVLPGTSGGPVTRNTLLPEFSTVRFERAGQQSWLTFERSPEDIWPELLAFAKKEKYLIYKTEPATGLLVTQWRPASAVAKANLLKNLIGADEEYSRLSFRIERNGTGSRLFARSQAASEKVANAPASDKIAWPASSHDPEETSAVLNSLLVFLGVEEQKARGIIDAGQASLVTDEALVQETGAGRQLVVQRGFKPTFTAVLAALNQLDYAVTSSDDGVGRIEFMDGETPMVIELTPQHISEVRAALSDMDGRRLPETTEETILNALLAKIA
ncbi:outer membrane protein assembly factor BamC [Granulosicoccus antarcticus]|uniref:Outer membrane protein assembly factor BamC n=1 Tax=Granulosicoccus antarcticus IMCC3135 TaxID=1192854 RepID=A0A2Z2P0Z9_9GAMM|nr:outer membrane protein assembly factor BamC [Granulosicoccus antarcticus]ASJ76071.1 Outer membrane protein assembly factor BamC [Granulosicoccus antarcticus IMCC3135]